MIAPSQTKTVTVVPATSERWIDMEKLFGKNGASGGCWCMFWRLPRSDFKAMQAEEHKAVLRSMTQNNQVPGVLAYLAGSAIGWCSIGPREDYIALEASRILKRVDDQPVWSIACFFVNKLYRQTGISRALLEGAVAYAQSKGAKIIEGYPIDLQTPELQGQKQLWLGY